MAAEIIKVEKDSIADELGIIKGDKLISLNGIKLRDYIDYQYLVACEELLIEVEHEDGQIESVEIEKDYDEDLGIVFSSAIFDKIKPCANHCIFCFVDGQPDGFRDTLYIKDDDYRLSYLQGSYVTLTNLTKADRERIAQMHLGPLYVSVHTMRSELRAKMLNNKRAANIRDELDFLKQNDIPFHAQIVMCPDYNDGDELLYTLNELDKYKSNLLSVAIVPVGITMYRKDKLKTVDKEIALKTIELVDNFNSKKRKYKVCLADEFFLKAEVEVPEKEYYGKFSQIEDGVGTIRLIKDDFKKQFRRLKKNFKKETALNVCVAMSGIKTFEKFKEKFETVKNLKMNIIPAKSEFWGETITVAGLLVSSDIKSAIEKSGIKGDIFIPSVMLSPYDNVFLDGKSVSDIEKELNVNIKVIKDYYSTREFVDYLNEKQK